MGFLFDSENANVLQFSLVEKVALFFFFASLQYAKSLRNNKQ
jgi:hypothetical protein